MTITKSISSFLLNFIHQSEKLKDIERHGWTSSGRQESVADHSWRVSLILMLVSPSLEHPINLEKALKIAIIHDLVEIYAGDVPYFEAPEGSLAHKEKNIREEMAISKIKKQLGEVLGDEIFDLWHEYYDCSSFEACVVKAIDKIEALIQQNEANPNTWLQCEIEDAINGKIRNYSLVDPTLLELVDEVLDESKHLISKL